MGDLCRYCSGITTSLAALFAPLTPLVWSVVGFILFDFLTGVWASLAEQRRRGKRWALESRLAWHTIEKMGFASTTLAMTFVIEIVILQSPTFQMTRLLAGFICGVELWSFIENACRISPSPLLRHIRKIVSNKINRKIDHE